jgi:hypothetical protein
VKTFHSFRERHGTGLKCFKRMSAQALAALVKGSTIRGGLRCQVLRLASER